MSEADLDPGKRRLERDVVSPRFESGVEAGSWRLISLAWPYLTVAITAGDGHELGMRLLVDGYPGQAPAGQPWDLATDTPLPPSRWPTGGMTAFVFRREDWSIQNGNAPYLACDRRALAGHQWGSQHPERAWNPNRSIEFYLEQIHHELSAATIPHP